MNRSLLSFLAVLLVSVVVAPELARADEVLERVVVRNRKHSSRQTFEVNPMFGTAITSRMTNQMQLQLGLAYNFTEQWGIEARGGYGLSSLTSVGEQAREGVMGASPFQPTAGGPPDEFQDLWRVQWQALIMPRWMPIYGKLNLVTEVPIHFQAYLTLGGGAVGLNSESVVYCQNGVTGPDNSPSRSETCQGYLEETRTTWAAAIGAGFRFFVHDNIALRLEFFDIAYPDEYRAGIDRKAAEREQPGTEPQQGTVTSAGLTNVLFFNLGASVAF